METTFRRNKKGEWVVYGPAKDVRAGHVQVVKKDRSTTSVQVVSTGKPFTVDGVEMVYGYLRKRTEVYNGPRRPRGEEEA